jgi:hypothetical protein
MQWVIGAISQRGKLLRREDDHLSATYVEVKKMWSYTSTPPYVFMA